MLNGLDKTEGCTLTCYWIAIGSGSKGNFGRERKGIESGKEEIKILMFVGGMMLYMEKTGHSTQPESC